MVDAGNPSSSDAFNAQFVVTNERGEIELLQTRLIGEAKRMQYNEASQFAVKLALEEALSNAFKHGNNADPAKKITVDCRVGPMEIHIEVEDEGPGFDPDAVPDPTEEENIEIPSGRGLVLIRSFMTSVRFAPPGNRLMMTYHRPADESA
ncbi:MAG: ATP-binding protein [Planctomycetota bacterium]|jgi:serine/threonine-protein kinase RsbW